MDKRYLTKVKNIMQQQTGNLQHKLSFKISPLLPEGRDSYSEIGKSTPVKYNILTVDESIPKAF